MQQHARADFRYSEGGVEGMSALLAWQAVWICHKVRFLPLKKNNGAERHLVVCGASLVSLSDQQFSVEREQIHSPADDTDDKAWLCGSSGRKSSFSEKKKKEKKLFKLGS